MFEIKRLWAFIIIITVPTNGARGVLWISVMSAMHACVKSPSLDQLQQRCLPTCNKS